MSDIWLPTQPVDATQAPNLAAGVSNCKVSRARLADELLPACGWACSMTKSRSQELSEKAAAERRRCRDWLLPFMQSGQPKLLTKDELRVAALPQLDVSKSSFDFAWIDAIETTGRHDWYEPLRRRPRTKS